MIRRMIAIALIAAVPAASAGAGENLLKNPGFEDGMAGWEVEVRGAWANKIDKAKIASVTEEAKSGNKALAIDTMSLNPSGEITDELRTWDNIKYEIFIRQKVQGVKPGAWYLAKFNVKSPGIPVDEGLEYLADLRPWNLQTFGPDAEKRPQWKMINAWEQRMFFPQAPVADGKYREYVFLVQTYDANSSIEMGFRIRAPWTGRIVVDDLELVEADPDKNMTKMEKFLAMRCTKPLAKVRELGRETTLVDKGAAACAILAPELPLYKELAAKIQGRIKDLSGVSPPVVSRLEDVPKGQNIVAVGSMLKNPLVGRLHFNHYVKIDGASPGPGGYVIWTVAEPYGLELKQNVVVVGGSDAAGERAAAEDFCGILKADAGTIRLGFLHKVFPERKILPDEKNIPRGEWGFDWERNRFGGFTNWYLPRWLATGDLEAASLAREEILKIADAYLQDPYFQTQWDTFEVGLAWDAMEEIPVFSDEDRLKVSNILLGYLHMRPQAGTSDWSSLVPRLAKGNPTWNHQAKGLSAVYTTGRYFNRFYPREDARYAYYLAAARNVFSQQAISAKPQENSGNYWLITMNYAIAYYLGEWDKVFFENVAMRRYAEYFATLCDNKGGLSGFGDSFYTYVGWTPGAGFGEWQVPLAFWYYKDGRLLWWLKHCRPDYINPYDTDIEPVEWKELVGVKRTPLEKPVYDPRRGLRLWGSGGDGTGEPTGDVAYEEAFDKITFRENWDPEGQYLCLEGLGRGIHSGKATNQICKLNILGEDLLIGSTYDGNTIRTNCSVLVVKDGNINDYKAKGNNRWSPWEPLYAEYPGYAAIEAMADLGKTGFTRTALRGHLGGTDWHRNIFWLKGDCFAMIDEIVAKDPGLYYAEANYSTCPKQRKTAPRLTPRTWNLLPENRGFEVTFHTRSDKVKLYILTDGASAVTADMGRDEGITKVIVRQSRDGVKLGGGEETTLFSLMYGDREGARKQYRLERLGAVEGLIFKEKEPVAYFGCGQTEKTASVLPIKARMFMLAGSTLALVDAASAGKYMASDKPASKEIDLPAAEASDILKKLAGLLK